MRYLFLLLFFVILGLLVHQFVVYSNAKVSPSTCVFGVENACGFGSYCREDFDPNVFAPVDGASSKPLVPPANSQPFCSSYLTDFFKSLGL
ncbi:MAG: hypothetical protein R3B92_02495 [Patescibacteria group bacterium]